MTMWARGVLPVEHVALRMLHGMIIAYVVVVVTASLVCTIFNLKVLLLLVEG